MKIERLVMFIIVAFAAIGLFGCVETPVYDPVGPADDEPAAPSTSSDARPAALEEAFPADGAVVSNDLVLFVKVESLRPVEVRFMLDAQEVGVVNEAPYKLELNGCELSRGSHLYTVEVIDENGNRDFKEQWFTVDDCD